MRYLFTIMLTLMLFMAGYASSYAQYGEHGKPRMLLVYTNSDVAPPNDDESDRILQAIKRSKIADEIMQEDFNSVKGAYTVMIKKITPVAMPNGYYDDLKLKLKEIFPRVAFQEIEFSTAYKWLNKEPVLH